ncbi:MAG: metallophosphoesterase [Thermoplasmatales archaeon]|nr:MAG: metallophosphoesterase [Thermoplasmatales archaeon]
MKLRFIFLLLLFVCLMVAPLYSQSDTLTIIHINDTHLLPWEPKNLNGEDTIGGIARISSVVGNLKATQPNPILLHAGDILVGDFMFNKFFAVPELQMMISLGFDALTLGNHEFDLYPLY